jgi:hypothetical protein
MAHPDARLIVSQIILDALNELKDGIAKGNRETAAGIEIHPQTALKVKSLQPP